MQLSKHFTLREMTNSMTAQRKGIDNTPGAGEIKSLGAWGGDFILAAGPSDSNKYFEKKGFKTVIRFMDMLKKS